MELPIKIQGNNILLEQIEVVNDRFNFIELTEKAIIKKCFAKYNYTHDCGILNPNEQYFVRDEIHLSKGLEGVGMQTNIKDDDKVNPVYFKITFSFDNGLQMDIDILDFEECKKSFKIVKQYFNYIVGL